MINNTLLEVAILLTKQGFKVFPVKPDKKPYTNHGLKDATQIESIVREFWRKWPNANIGLVTDDLFVLDFDAKSGGLESKIKLETEYEPLPQTKTHRTGGGGLHLIYRNPNGTPIRNTVKFGGYPGIDLRADGGYIVAPPSLHESGAKYEVIDDAEIAPVPNWLIDLATKKLVKAEATPESLTIPEGQRNHTLTSQAGTMRWRGMPQEAIEAALLEVNIRQCQPSLPESEVRTIAQSISRYPPNGNTHVYIRTQQGETKTNRNKNATDIATVESKANGETQQQPLSKRIENWVASTVGWFDTPEMDRDLGLYSTADRNNRREIMLRLIDKGIIERHQKINKQFRYINTRETCLNFKAANNAGVLPLQWPLGIERHVNLFPGNIAVIAGSPNAGKTALMLYVIYLNQNNFPVFYFCSEMGAVELRDRLDKFPGMDVEDWHFEAIERVSDFADVIRPDCVNIIDYLEMTTELYAVNTHLTAISHKLGSGIAIVAIQKKKGASYGRGQEFSLEKPKLYLSIDMGKLQIVKGKSWAKKNANPNGLTITFKIIGGCQFQANGEWDYE
ncbi:bifunctional DNA primase/polymerase [Chloroflexota bacterium]